MSGQHSEQHQITGGPDDHWLLAQQAAKLLLQAREDGAAALPSLPEHLRPATEAQAYAVQQASLPALGPVGGWKVGASGKDADAHVSCAPLPLGGLHGDGAILDPRRFTLRGVEAEICVRMGRDLPPRDVPYSRAEVIAAIDTCHPAIEVLQSRFVDPDVQDRLSQLADLISHGALIVGPPIAAWQDMDLAREDVRVMVDGAEQIRRTGNPAGEMIRLIVWLANAGSHRAGGLRAGQVITTGSWTGKTIVGPEARAQAVFARAGTVSVRFGVP